MSKSVKNQRPPPKGLGLSKVSQLKMPVKPNTFTRDSQENIPGVPWYMKRPNKKALMTKRLRPRRENLFAQKNFREKPSEYFTLVKYPEEKPKINRPTVEGIHRKYPLKKWSVATTNIDKTLAIVIFPLINCSFFKDVHVFMTC